ncbi:MAG: hypothetical protein ACK5AZ_03745 [Bryobacteraceae bacterium]
MKPLLGFAAGVAVASALAVVVVQRSREAPAAPVIEEMAPAAAVPAPVKEIAPPAPEPEPVRPVERAAAPARRPAPVPVAKPAEAARAPAPVLESAPVASATPAPVPASVPEPARAVEPPPPPPPPAPKTVTIPIGTLLAVRMEEGLSTDRNETGDTFTASLAQPLVIDGMVIAERGARLQGRVVESDKAGRVRGLAGLAVELTTLNTADGQRIPISTDAFRIEGRSTKKKDAAKVGAAAGIGAAIGAIAGGGRGAAIGAAAGGGAGTGAVLATRGEAATIPVETRISFRLNDPVKITEKLR